MRYAMVYCCLACLIAVSALASPQDLVVRVQGESSAWAESQLSDKLHREFTRIQDVRVRMADSTLSGLPPFPANIFAVDSLLMWGREARAECLMVVVVNSQRLETRRTFNFPLIFHKYEAYGVIDGELRFLDLRKNRLTVAEPFSIELKGPRILQGSAEDNKNDPDLHLTASEKALFFSRLEDKAVTYLADRVNHQLGAR